MPSLIELLENNSSFKYGTNYNKVEAEKQSLSNFEANGLRPNFGDLGTSLYGTDTLRITKQSTALVDDMRQSASVNQGLLGGITNFTNKVGNQFASALGIPVLQIPTRVSQDNELKIAIQGDGPEDNNVMIALAKIRKKQEGNILGKFLKQTAKGTPDQLGRRAVGTARNIAKNAAKNLLFGDGSGGVNEVANQTLSIREDVGIKYGSRRANQYSSQLGRRSVDGELGVYTLLNDIQNRDSSVDIFITDKQREDTVNRPYSDNKEIFPDFPEFSIESITQNIPGRPEKKYSDGVVSSLRIDSSNNGKLQSTSDPINKAITYTSSDESGTPDSFLVDDKTYDDLDFIPLRFYSVSKREGVAFKATLNGVSETTSPSWTPNKFLGNPFETYTYDSVSRAITFNFSVYSLNSQEHISCWERLNFLTSLTYPQNVNSFDIYTTPPVLRLTLGNLYSNKLGFIESLSYTIDDNVPWEIGYGIESNKEELESILDNKNSIRITKINKTSPTNIEYYKLPAIVNVSVGFKFIESPSETIGKRLYSFGKPLTN